MPNLGLLSVQNILTQGCQQGKNPGLLNTPPGGSEPYSLTALKLFLHRISLNYDLPWLLTEASVSTSNNYEISLSALTRYRSIKSLLLDDIGELVQSQSYADIWKKLKKDLSLATTPYGVPAEFYPAPDRSKLLIYPIPQAVKNGDLLYYSLPDYSTITTGTAASALSYEDSAGLVKIVEAFCKNWDGDNMAAMVDMIAEQQFGKYKISAEDNARMTRPTLRLSPTWFNYKQDS